MIDIRPARAEEMDGVRQLLREYEASIGHDLCFQSFEAELAGLPGRYAPPKGALVVAVRNDLEQPLMARPIAASQKNRTLAGCVAVRPLAGNEATAEMKRLFVIPEQRGAGLGRRLAIAAIEAARAAAYRDLVLDTLASMQTAITLYQSLGFVETEPYYSNPLAGVVYLRKRLAENR